MDTAAAPMTRWYSLDGSEAIDRLSSDGVNGLSAAEATRRMAEFGPNEPHAEAAPSIWKVALGQLVDPMNLILVAVAGVSLVLGETSTHSLNSRFHKRAW